MARKPTVPCARCDRLLWSGSTSLPAGRATCRPCRRRDPGPARQKDCPNCGRAFTAPGSKTCSRECGQQHRRAQVPVERRRTVRICEICGIHYVRTYQAQRTCGRTCGAVLSSASRPPRRPKVVPARRARTCQRCCAPHSSRRTKYCSDTCAAAEARDRNLVRYGRTAVEVDRCGACGCVVPMRRKRCSPCLDAANREARRRAKRRRRALERGARHENYTSAEIAERDRFRCGLCRGRVAMTRVVPHPKAPTIDHVIPLACGGDDIRSNVQLAHFICNSTKSAGGQSQQLALVG